MRDGAALSNEDEAVAWLRGAINARKALAEAATPGPWEFEGDDPTDDELYSVHDGEHGDLIGQTVAWTRHRQVANGRLMEANDPRDTIARCEAELAILDEHASDGSKIEPQCIRCANTHPDRCECGWQSGGGEHWRTAQSYPCTTVRRVASAYRHRDGYAQHWGNTVEAGLSRD